MTMPASPSPAHNAVPSASSLETDWSRDAIVARRDKFYSASQRAFVPYKTPVVLKRGSMQYLWDDSDRQYIDCLAQNLCISVGHNHPVVTREVVQQAQSLQHCTTMFYHPVPAHLAEELVATMPSGVEWVVHFTNSGAEAADLAMLMARSYTGNSDVIALHGGYHGAISSAMTLTGISGFRHNVPMMSNVVHVANPDQYRGAHGAGAGAQPYLDDLDRTIQYATSGMLAGMFIEPIQGYGGIVAMPPDYIAGAFERVRAAGGLGIIDEVQTGFGRTGAHFWGFESHNVVPDIVIMAKGIGNGYPIAAVVARRDIAESLAKKFYFNTYGANPVCCAAGRAVLQVIREEKLQQNAETVGATMLKVLEDLKQRHDIIGDVRGQGLMMAIELVKDRKSQAPAVEETAQVFEATRDNGLIVSKSGAFRNVLRICPPLCIQESDVPAFAEALDRSFRGL